MTVIYGFHYKACIVQVEFGLVHEAAREDWRRREEETKTIKKDNKSMPVRRFLSTNN